MNKFESKPLDIYVYVYYISCKEIVSESVSRRSLLQRVLTSKQQHAQKKSIVELKISAHFERYVSGIW
jgi:hypothetical protein